MRFPLILISMVMTISTSIAENIHTTTQTTQDAKPRVYKGVELSNDLFDSNTSCGLNAEKVEECIKSRATAMGGGEGFCNDIKLFAGNMQKIHDLMERKAENIRKQEENKKATGKSKKKPDMKDPNDPTLIQMQIEGIKITQTRLTTEFMASNVLTSEQLGKILPLKMGDKAQGQIRCK